MVSMAKAKTKEVWIDIDTAPPELMAQALGCERNRILAQLCQVKNDLDHYNEYRNKGGKPLIFIFDFTDDIAEYVASGKDRGFLSPEQYVRQVHATRTSDVW